MLRNRPPTLTLGTTCVVPLRRPSKTRVKCMYSADGQDFNRILDALKWEEKRGFKNAQGYNEPFAAFLRRSITDLKIPSKLGHQKQVLSTGLTHYDSLDVLNRKEVIQSCRSFIDKMSSLQSHKHEQIKNNVKTKSQLHAKLFVQTAEKTYTSEASEEKADASQIMNRTERWKLYHQERLTTSTFARVLGMTSVDPAHDVQELWLEKLGIKESFQGNKMTQWSAKMKHVARSDYCRFTGHSTSHPSMRSLGQHQSESWLIGSCNGLVEITDKVIPQDLPKEALEVLVPESSQGLLEIQCPFGDTKTPDHVQVPDQMAAHFMPQVQGLMEIFDQDWCHLFYWTKNNGAKIFLVYRNKQYWNALYAVLAQFWWEHVVPAKLCIEANDGICGNYENYRPQLDDTMLDLIQESKRLAQNALQLQFDPNGRLVS